MKKYGIILLTILALILAGTLYWLNKDNTVSVTTEEQTTLSPTQVESIEAIGEWEFLAINMKDVKEGWIQANAGKDSIVCTLPPIRLLDNNFIDEARTRSFFEEGKWTGADRQALYDRAYAQMKKRCLTPANIRIAQRNARQQFRDMFKAMGFPNARVEFEEK